MRRYRPRPLRWLLILVLFWQGLVSASMVPQWRTVTATSAMPPCHEAGMTGMAHSAPGAGAVASKHVVVDSCCAQGACAIGALCAACVLPAQAAIPALRPVAAAPLPPLAAGLRAAPDSHPFRPPIL